jgi:hypothetical protein
MEASINRTAKREETVITLEERKEFVRRVYEDVFNTGTGLKYAHLWAS